MSKHVRLLALIPILLLALSGIRVAAGAVGREGRRAAPIHVSQQPRRVTSQSSARIIFQNGVSPNPAYEGGADAIITTWGGNQYANLGGLEYLQIGETGDADQFRSLLRFELGDWLPANVQIEQAWLELYAYNGDFDDKAQDAIAHRVTTAWVEGEGWNLFGDGRDEGVTWVTARPDVPWNTAGGDFAVAALDTVSVGADAEGWQRWDVTEAARAWWDGAANNGVLIEPANAAWVHHEFHSSEAISVTLRPRLIVDYALPTATPTPHPEQRLYLPLILRYAAITPHPTTTPTLTSTHTATFTLTPTSSPTLTPTPTPVAGGAHRLQPSDITYLGAFRLPDVAGEDTNGWKWANWSSALAYYPDGDPDGPNDGFPGSLFGTGHDWNQWVSEVSIPTPVLSPSKTLYDLPTAALLQPFSDIRGALFGEMEMPRVGLAYLPAQGAQTSGKLYFTWAGHAPGQPGDTGPSHGWAELDLTTPRPAGNWRVAGLSKYLTGDYLFPIPQSWANAHAEGRLLATGRFRDGGQAAEGPALFAIAPWAQGNPPAAGATLPATTLLRYEDVSQQNPRAMNNYHHSDEWSGAAWLTASEKAAVIFVGTKGIGDNWYGCADGVDQPPWPDDCERGWWSSTFEAQMLFYDPAELAAVARGEMPSWQPQPYAAMNIDPYLYHITSTQQKHHLVAAAFDRARGRLYILEPLADEDKPLVHVWRVDS